ncbi:hypothetical protein BB561_004485 [Smittium simulii]|uniref:Uncharacterized protein n=1 Tax=Smittium simulii TaxID=133385 RepID=A0A2T9YG91_9FUNG|nr:hypothetical protein BB561_004485 [Smittium simulii]
MFALSNISSLCICVLESSKLFRFWELLQKISKLHYSDIVAENICLCLISEKMVFMAGVLLHHS